MMKFLPYVFKHLRRNWIRTASTVVAMGSCIFLFCTLQAFLGGVNTNLQTANASRLVSRHAVSMVFNMPIAYKERIKSIEGVESVANLNWFGGTRKPNDFSEFFPNMAVDPEEYLALYPELMLPDDQKRAWFEDPRGCIIGRKTAERFDWKIGDTFQLESFIPPYRIGKPFEFVVRGIFESDPVRYPGTDLTLMLFQFKYLYEATRQRSGVGNFVVGIGDPTRAGDLSKAIDTLFENSEVQTHTETESAFRAAFISQVGNLTLLLNSIALAVMFTILLVTANTMSMTVRERRTEIGVLKTLGFPSRLVMGLVMAEALVISTLGAGLGLLLAKGMIENLADIPFLGQAVGGLPDLGLDPGTAILGASVALGLGLSAGFIPALSAYRSKITDILRTV